MLKIGIFCASSPNISPVYYEQTACLGEWIGKHNHSIIYGGTAQGLMECIARSVKKSGGNTIGILPRDMHEKGLGSSCVDQLIITEDLAGRKNKIMEMADIFIALPGGFGTLDEIFHIVAGGQVGYHRKSLLLFNQNNFYRSLIQQISQMSEEQFTPPQCQDKVIAVNTIEECVDQLLKCDERKIV